MRSAFFGAAPNSKLPKAKPKPKLISFSALKTAITADDLETFDAYFLSHKEDAKHLNAATVLEHHTIFMLTILSKNSRLALKALNNPLIDVNAVARNGDCAITMAMSLNDVPVLSKMLTVDKNRLALQQHGHALFIWSATNGHEVLIRDLVNHPWFAEYIKQNPSFAQVLLLAALNSRKFQSLRCLVELGVVDVNTSITVVNEKFKDELFKNIPDGEQALLKYLLCRPDSDMNWRLHLSEESHAVSLICKLAAPEIRFLIMHPAIRVQHGTQKVVNPNSFKEKNIYFEQPCLTLNNADGTVCNVDDLVQVMLECPTFDRDLVVWENKSTNDLIHEKSSESLPQTPTVTELSTEDTSRSGSSIYRLI